MHIMTNRHIRLSIALGLLVPFCAALVFGQENGHEPSELRGDPTERRKTNIDGNQVRTTIFNYGQTGRTEANAPGEIPYEWPKNTQQHYIALTGLFVGGEVVNVQGDTIKIVDVPNYRTNPQGDTWNLEPVPEYTSEDTNMIAKSTVPESWPDYWPDKLDDPNDPGWRGSWNGFFGKDQFSADQELYYRASDDLYDRHQYYPDSTDQSRRGLGLLIDVRVMAWSQILVNDVVYILHEITNDGTRDIEKTSFALWLADLVGGDGDSGDDEPSFDQVNDVAWSKDGDGIGNDAFGDEPVGVAATTFLETPGNAVDGIDNDGDADEYPMLLSEWDQELVPKFVEADFEAQYKAPGATLVLIDPDTYSRTVIQYPNTDTVVYSMGRAFTLPAGGRLLSEVSFEETHDLIDNDLDGLIDEQASLHLNRVKRDGTTEPVRYINYTAFPVGTTLQRGLLIPGTDITHTQQTVAPMIDEARNDGVDNDRDWRALLDDVGFDGDPESGDQGEGDGEPTSGAGTELPGEPNIDKTDIAESDQIGLTGASYIGAGEINFESIADSRLWRLTLSPGEFFDPMEQLPADADLFVNAGYFPLEAGQTERISMAIALGEDEDDALSNREAALEAYEADYQFAKAPLSPTVNAVAKDGMVRLYWDDIAEESFDRFMADRGLSGFDFEGYRIYRATDPAFEDAYTITNAYGNLTYYEPIAQFDKEDGVTGLHPVDVNGVHFDLGEDTGLRHVYTDTDVTNGQTYYYAVTAYDFGGPAGEGIAPSETPIAISIRPDGSADLGSNVVKVTPSPEPAGYLPAEVSAFDHISGSATGDISIDVVDPATVKDRNTYLITFADTVYESGSTTRPDTLRTKWFNLFNVTAADTDTVLWQNPNFSAEDEVPLTDGFQLQFSNEDRVRFSGTESEWRETNEVKVGFSMRVHQLGFSLGEPYPSDYEIEIGEVGIDTSEAVGSFDVGTTLPAKPVNFRVKNLSQGRYIDFAFWELDTTGGPGRITVNEEESDRIIFIDSTETDSAKVTWQFSLLWDSTAAQPAEGDVAFIRVEKPFLSRDTYRFTTYGDSINADTLDQDISKIKVVPNPYVAGASWEPRNPYNTGRGPRAIHFNHVPKHCTIRIFNIAGELVDVIHVNNAEADGTAEWDLLQKDELKISYGVYFYHVETENGATQTGKFAIIK